MPAAPDRDKALDIAMSQIEKNFGKGAIMRLGDDTRPPIQTIPSGSLALDLALGIGGYPRGRIVEIYGPESAGKTTFALHAIASAQAAGGIAAFIDAEHALDPIYAKNLGVDTDALLVSQPDTGEQALEIADMLIRSGSLDIIVIDSVAALVPRAEIEGEMGDSHVGLQARLMSQALRKITGALSQSGTTAVFINQLREKVGIVYGSPEVTTGGKALKFYASIRLDVRRIASLKDGTEVVGNQTRCKVVKNKCLAAGTRIFDPVTGTVHAIEDIVEGRLPVHVVAADKKGLLHVREVTSWFDQGEQPVVKIRMKGGAVLTATPDHKVMTDRGWVEAGELTTEDRVAQPRQFGQFGEARPFTAEEARLLGYLIGDGYVGGKTPIAFINIQEDLIADASAIASTLGCESHRKEQGISVSFSHRKGEKNGVLELCRRAGIWGHLALTKQIPAAFFGEEVAEDILANLVFGLLETDGWIGREQTGAIRVGYTSTSRQLVEQLRWLLLRWGITSTVRKHEPDGRRHSLIGGHRVVTKLTSWDLRIAGIENVAAFAEAVPTWGPRGTVLVEALDALQGRHRGSQQVYLSRAWTEPVLAHLRERGLRPVDVAAVLGRSLKDAEGGFRNLLGVDRLRRDRVADLADGLDDAFLRDVLSEQVAYARVLSVEPAGTVATYDVEVDDLHTLVADGCVVHNCAPPFRQAEVEIEFGVGISRMAELIDIGVEHGFVRKSGAWYTYEGDQLGQGKENAKQFLRDNPDLANELEKKIKEKLGIIPTVDAPVDLTADVLAPEPVDF